MKITNEQMVSILDELRPEKQEPGDVTVKEAAKDWAVSIACARTILEDEVEKGNLIRVNGVRNNSGKGLFYRKK